MVFQSYTLYKRTLVVSDLVLARRGSENVFDRPLSFSNKCLITTDSFYEFQKIDIMCYYFIIISDIKFKLLVYSSMKCSYFDFSSLAV